MTPSVDQIAQDVAKHVLRRDGTGRPRYFSEEARAAMRMLENLINAGDLALVPDSWAEGRLVFVRAPLLMAPKTEESPSPVNAIQGEVMGFALDPLESAIESTVRLVDDRLAADHPSSLNISTMLVGHLEDLLAEQLKRVTADETL